MARRRKVFSGQISDVDIRLMRVFRTVIECGGLSAAQTELGVGRSTISRQIADLETRLGLRLCHRGRAGFSLTQAGRQVLDYVDRFLKSADDFSANIAAMGDRLVGRLEIGLMDFALTDEANPLLGAIKTCRADAPGLTVNITVGTPAEIERGVLDGRLHLGVVPDYHRTPGLQCHPLYDEPVGLFCGGDHPLAQALDRGAPLSEREIRAHALVYRGYFESDLLRQRKLAFPQGSTAYQTEAVMGLIQSGIYIGFLPVHCQRHLHGRSHELLPELFRYSTPIHAIWRSDREQSATLSDFLPLFLG
ncbi:LysR family transcriptional regulator [Thioclava sp. GXIMD4215]|uniref:LysR family transcriptional regulator n=1 Tax=Thioclava sp. GXIMD4215 TaxID=3131928 RepID=UPI00311AC98D